MIFFKTGSEWILSDTIELRDVIVNQGGFLSHDLDLSVLSSLTEDLPSTKHQNQDNEGLSGPSRTVRIDESALRVQNEYGELWFTSLFLIFMLFLFPV